MKKLRLLYFLVTLLGCFSISTSYAEDGKYQLYGWEVALEGNVDHVPFQVPAVLFVLYPSAPSMNNDSFYNAPNAVEMLLWTNNIPSANPTTFPQSSVTFMTHSFWYYIITNTSPFGNLIDLAYTSASSDFQFLQGCVDIELDENLHTISSLVNVYSNGNPQGVVSGLANICFQENGQTVTGAIELEGNGMVGGGPSTYQANFQGNLAATTPPLTWADIEQLTITVTDNTNGQEPNPAQVCAGRALQCKIACGPYLGQSDSELFQCRQLCLQRHNQCLNNGGVWQ